MRSATWSHASPTSIRPPSTDCSASMECGGTRSTSTRGGLDLGSGKTALIGAGGSAASTCRRSYARKSQTLRQQVCGNLVHGPWVGYWNLKSRAGDGSAIHCQKHSMVTGAQQAERTRQYVSIASTAGTQAAEHNRLFRD